jgi:hypothetical protein
MGGVVPLSEHEQRQLEQIEQGLYREDRRLARLVRSSDPRVHYKRRVVQALVGLAIGAGMIAAGIVVGLIGLTVAGIVITLLSAALAFSSWRQMATVALGSSGRGTPGKGGSTGSGRRRGRRGARSRAPRGTFGDRLDERWRRRVEGDDR